MKLANWNVNSLNARLPRVLEFLRQHRPDVLCLQETKCEARALPHVELAERLTACGIDRGYRKGPKPSDHAPLLAEIA